MLHRFDADTALRRVGPGRLEGRIDRGWWIVRGPNGGYVAALALRAAQEAVGESERLPRSLSVHFTAPPAEGPVCLETRVERAGRSLSTVSVRMLQEGRLVAMGLAALSKSRPGPELDRTRMPEVPPPEACTPVAPAAGDMALRARYEYRPVFGRDSGSASPDGVIGGWIRLRPPRAFDALLVAAVCDAWPPAVYASLPERMGGRGVPTVDLHVHFRSPLPRPGAAADELVLALFRSRLVRDGFLEEDGEIWASDGTLVAQSRQLAVSV